MLDVDAIAQRGVQHRLADLRLDNGAFRAMVGIGQENDLRHLGQSSISFSRRPASAALTVESSRRAAKASVIWLRRLVWRSMASTSWLSSNPRNSATWESIATRSAADSKRQQSTEPPASNAPRRGGAHTK